LIVVSNASPLIILAKVGDLEGCSVLWRHLVFEDALDIPLPVQNPNNVNTVAVHEIINADCLEPRNRPAPQVVKLRIA